MMVSKLLLLKLEVEELSGLRFITKQVEHKHKSQDVLLQDV
jgi:hypothetical protein